MDQSDYLDVNKMVKLHMADVGGDEMAYRRGWKTAQDKKACDPRKFGYRNDESQHSFRVGYCAGQAAIELAAEAHALVLKGIEADQPAAKQAAPKQGR